ncbi:hypothetical protein [Rheinheimera fenheensis]|uniref:hypothetical protein n=1 Tax=Rheinheimera fenheensis TaxID=3152295 RepID=UPI0032611C88
MTDSFEEDYKGYTIYVEPSADRWNPAFTWSICKNGIEYDSGLNFSPESAIAEAKEVLEKMLTN